MYVDVCRLKLCATVGLCGVGKLKRSCGGTSLHSVVDLRVHAKATSISRRQSSSLFTARFFFDLLCWSLSSLSWNPQVTNIFCMSISNICVGIYYIHKGLLALHEPVVSVDCWFCWTHVFRGQYFGPELGFTINL